MQQQVRSEAPPLWRSGLVLVLCFRTHKHTHTHMLPVWRRGLVFRFFASQ